jgi:hypothetical protein
MMGLQILKGIPLLDVFIFKFKIDFKAVYELLTGEIYAFSRSNVKNEDTCIVTLG